MLTLNPIRWPKLFVEWSDAQSYGGLDAYRRFRRTGSIEPEEPPFDPAARGLFHDEQYGMWYPTSARPALYPTVEAENGHIYLRPRDWPSGMLVIGGQGTGKSSIALRHYLNAVQDVRGAVVLVDRKRTLALRALAHTPLRCGKRVWYLQLAQPAFGMSPMRMAASEEAIMSVIVEALRDVFPEQLFQASREVIRHCVLAALALATAEQRPARIEDVFDLMVWDNEGLRARAAAACSRIPNGDRVRNYLTVTLPGEMARNPSGTSERLRAPRNKLDALLGSPPLRIFFNHTTEKPLAEIIRDREILIVDGELGPGGDENAQLMIAFILRMLDSALKHQQGLPQDQLAKVHLIIDEAGHVLGEHVIAMIDSHREAGLDVMAVLHYMDQLAPKVLKGALNLLRNKYVFRISESGDSVKLAKEVSGMVYDTFAEQARGRIWPETPQELGNWRCLVSHLPGGKPASVFVGRPYPMPDASVIGWRKHWFEWLASQVGEYPEHILWTLRERPEPETIAAERTGDGANEATVKQPPAPAAEADSKASASVKPERARQAVARLDDARRLAAAAKLEVSLARLELGAFSSPGIDPEELRKLGVRAPRAIAELVAIDRILYRTAEPLEDEEDKVLPRLNDNDMAALAVLDRLGFLTIEQLRRMIWPSTTLDNVHKTLRKLASAGLVHRFPVQLEDQRGGRSTYLYALSPKGLYTGQHPPSGRRPSIDEHRQHKLSQATAGSDLQHDLMVASWLISFRHAFAALMSENWRTPRYATGHLDVPFASAARRGERRALSMFDAERALHEYYCFADAHVPQKVTPDLTVELRIAHRDNQRAEGDGRQVTTDLLVEVDNTGRPDYNAGKLRAYDSLLCGWCRSLPRYQRLGTRPFCLFVARTSTRWTG